MLLSSLALLRPPTSRLGASMAATATAEPLAPQRFGPDRPLELGGCACEVATGSAGGELQRLRGLFDAATLDALLAAARSSMHFETDPDTVDGSATYHASIIEAGEPVDATLAALLEPVLETRLLPYLRAQYACPDIVVADALVRRYSPEERPSLSTHYDVAACATAIVLLAWSKRSLGPFGSAPARLLRLLRARPAALCGSVLLGRGRPTGRPATASGARASRLQGRPFPRLCAPITFAHPGAAGRRE
jgi:hypothetical protein